MGGLQTIVEEMEKNNENTEEIIMEGVKGLVYRQDRNTEPKDVTVFYSPDQDEMNVSVDKLLFFTILLLCDFSLILFYTGY